MGYIGRVGGFFTFQGMGNRVFGISNNHVIANLNNCAFGDVIVNGAGSPVGQLYGWVDLNIPGNNILDLAFFELDANTAPAWNMPGALKRPVDFIAPHVNGSVYMVKGNTQRMGQIKNYEPGPTSFNSHGTNIDYINLYAIESNDGAVFSEDGDSGSLIFTSNHYIVGLLVGARNNSTTSYFIPFSTILSHYGMSIY